MKTNCLTRALDQWNEDKSMRLWYNEHNVICLEKYDMVEIYNVLGTDSSPKSYELLERYGSQHFIVSFKLSMRHLKLLGEYFNSLSNTKIV